MSKNYNTDKYIDKITYMLKKNSNPDYAEKMKKYMRNKLEFY